MRTVLKSVMAGAAMLVLLASPVCVQAAGKKVALLVGVGVYPTLDSGKGEGQLEGPLHDVEALRDTLIRHWGFRGEDIQTLVNAAASRQGILAGIDALAQRSGRDDHVFIYLSGHGTSGLDQSTSMLSLPYGTGAFAPADVNFSNPKPLSTLIVGRTDLRPRLKALEAGGRHLWVISDSCYSGSQVRNPIGSNSLAARYLPLPNRSLVEDIQASGAVSGAPTEPYPYRDMVFLSAASEGEQARDISTKNLKAWPTLDNKPHGAFTDALLRVLSGKQRADLNGDGVLSMAEVQHTVIELMSSRAVGHSPQLLPALADDTSGLTQRGLFGMPAVPAPDTLVSHENVLRVRVDASAPAAARNVIEKALVKGVVNAGNGAYDVRIAASTRDGEEAGIFLPSGDHLGTLRVSRTASGASSMQQMLTNRLNQLAWAKRLRFFGETNRRSLLPLELNPSAFGGNFVLGSTFNFVVKPDRKASLLLIDVNAEGRISVLYPFKQAELSPLSANAPTFIPSARKDDLIVVTEPLGTDLVFAFAFDDSPSELEHLLNLEQVSPEDARLQVLERLLQNSKGKFSFAFTELRILPRTGQ